MNKTLWAVLVIVAGILCAMADLAHSAGNSDITGYTGVPWGTEYKEASTMLDEMGGGKLYAPSCDGFPCSTYFTDGLGFGGVNFKRLAIFDNGMKLVAVKMMAEAPTACSPAVFDAVVDWLESAYGTPDVSMSTATMVGTKQVFSWRRKSGNVTFRYVHMGEHNGYSILFTQMKE